MLEGDDKAKFIGEVLATIDSCKSGLLEVRAIEDGLREMCRALRLGNYERYNALESMKSKLNGELESQRINLAKLRGE